MAQSPRQSTAAPLHVATLQLDGFDLWLPANTPYSAPPLDSTVRNRPQLLTVELSKAAVRKCFEKTERTFSPFWRLGCEIRVGVLHSSMAPGRIVPVLFPACFWGWKSSLGFLDPQLHQSTPCCVVPRVSPRSSCPSPSLSFLPPLSPTPLSLFFIFLKTWSHYIAQAGQGVHLSVNHAELGPSTCIPV